VIDMRKYLLKSAIVAIVPLLIANFSPIVMAQEARASFSRSPFKFSAGVDAPLLGVSLLLWITPAFLEGSLPGPHCDPCAPSDLNGLDRPVINFHSPLAGKVSDGLVVAIPTLAFAGSFLHFKEMGWRGVGEDALLLAQAMALSGMTQSLVSLAVRRPRPFMYQQGVELEQRRSADASHSFFSGHTTAVFSAASAFATIYSIRRPKSPLRPLVWILALGAASAVPVLRVAAGEHFWSDVLVGAAVGSAFGILIPAAHHRRGIAKAIPSWLSVGPGPASGASLWARF
jgi:membrane-associated phospholipid phosphatase